MTAHAPRGSASGDADGAATVHLAFLGCGRATTMHSRTLRSLDRNVRRHYASRSAAKAQEFTRELGGDGAFASYREAIESPGIDVVLVATPPTSHLDLTVQALDAGKHVVVEKPAFTCGRDFDRVERARERHRRQVLVAENYHYKPLLLRLRELLAEGAVGEPSFVLVNALKHQRTGDWRDDPARSGGGALIEGGIHWVDFLAELGPEVVAVRGVRAGDRGFVLSVGYAGGGAGVLLHSWDVPSPLRGLRLSRIYGSEGSIAFESNGLFVFVRGRRTRLMFPGFRDISGYRAMFGDFLAALRTGSEPRMTLAKARRDVELVEAARASAALTGGAATEAGGRRDAEAAAAGPAAGGEAAGGEAASAEP